MCSKQDIPCVRSRTFLVFQAERPLCSKQNILCVRSRTFLAFEAGHSLWSKQNILPYVRGRTFLVFQAIHFLCSNENHEKSFQLQTYWSYPLKSVIFRARFFKAHDAMVSSDVAFSGSASAPYRDVQSCKIFKRPKNREDSSDFDDFLTKLIASARSKFRKKLRAVLFVVVVVVVVHEHTRCRGVTF